VDGRVSGLLCRSGPRTQLRSGNRNGPAVSSVSSAYDRAGGGEPRERVAEALVAHAEFGAELGVAQRRPGARESLEEAAVQMTPTIDSSIRMRTRPALRSWVLEARRSVRVFGYWCVVARSRLRWPRLATVVAISVGKEASDQSWAARVWTTVRRTWGAESAWSWARFERIALMGRCLRG
jgi:hypothetical protein